MDAVRERETGLVNLFGNCDSLHTRVYAQALCYSPRNETPSGAEYPGPQPDKAENDNTR
jgi:hypothetical protein